MKDLVRESKYTSGHKCEPGANRRQEQHCPEGIQDCENPRPQIPHQLTIPPNSNASNTSNENKYKIIISNNYPQCPIFYNQCALSCCRRSSRRSGSCKPKACFKRVTIPQFSAATKTSLNQELKNQQHFLYRNCHKDHARVCRILCPLPPSWQTIQRTIHTTAHQHKYTNNNADSRNETNSCTQIQSSVTLGSPAQSMKHMPQLH